MTPAEQALLNRIKRRAGQLSPRLAAALLRAWDKVRSSYSESEVASLITTGRVDAVLERVFSQEVVNSAMMPVRETLRTGVFDGARSFTRDIPAARIRGGFDSLSPNVIEGIRTLETRVVTTLDDEARETVRQTVTRGLTDGASPRAVARELRSVIGLAPNQEAAISNFRKMLENGDREALTRALRDKRFDGTLKKALGEGGTGLRGEQVDRMVEQYRKRMVAFNTETNAHTAALDAQKAAQRLSWEQAVEQGIVDGSRLMKRWRTVRDSRVRDEHAAMDGETVRFDEPFSNGEMTPGESTYNCRCVTVVFLSRAP